jgi:hypothetical protein
METKRETVFSLFLQNGRAEVDLERRGTGYIGENSVLRACLKNKNAPRKERFSGGRKDQTLLDA